MSHEKTVTNYKKLFHKHVHEQFFLKKHMNKIDYEMRQRDKQISGDQAIFMKRYNKFITAKHDCNFKGNIERRRSFSDTSEIEKGNTKMLLASREEKRSQEKHTIGVKFPSKRRASLVDKIRKNSYTEPPVDFPYSFPQWHERVDNCAFEDDGSDPRDLRKENFLLFLEKLDGDYNNNVADDTSILTWKDSKLKSMDTPKFSQETKETDIAEIQIDFEKGTTNMHEIDRKRDKPVDKEPLKLPDIDARPRSRSFCLQSVKSTENITRKVRFSTELEIIDIRNIDIKMGRLLERRQSFTEFKSSAMKPL